jgi:hypothetical protein
MRSPFIDELTFGEWWLCAGSLLAELDVSTPREREFITRSLVAYVETSRRIGVQIAPETRGQLISWLDEQSLGSGSTVLDRLSAGGSVSSDVWQRDADPQVIPAHSSPTNEVTLAQRDTDDLLAGLARAAAITGCDLHALGVRLTRKWALDAADLPRTVSRISDALDVSHPVTATRVPPSLSTFVDQAMFVPLPQECGTVIFVSPRYLRLGARDPFALSRLVLAVAHEVAGHARDYRYLMSSLPGCRWLDRELLEGWGIVAEGRLSALGDDEHALHLLYVAKRFLPLAHRTLDESGWARMRHEIEAIWPGFFSSTATEVLRRATGTHARGLVRVRRALQVYGEAARFGTASPWRTK